MSDDAIDDGYAQPSIETLRVTGELRRINPELDARIDLGDTYRRVYDGADGEVVLRDILREAGLLEIARDPNDRGFYEGKRAMAIFILGRLRFGVDELRRRNIGFQELTGGLL